MKDSKYKSAIVLLNLFLIHFTIEKDILQLTYKNKEDSLIMFIF